MYFGLVRLLVTNLCDNRYKLPFLAWAKNFPLLQANLLESLGLPCEYSPPFADPLCQKCPHHMGDAQREWLDLD